MVDHRRRTTRRTALFADTLEDDSSVSPTTTPFLASSSYRRPPSLLLAPLSLLPPPLSWRATIPIPGIPSSSVPAKEGSSDYGQRVSTTDQRGFIGGTGPGPARPRSTPFSAQMGYIRPSAIDIIRLFRDNLPRIVRYRSFLFFSFLFFFTIESISFHRWKRWAPFAIDCRDGEIVSPRPDLLYHTKIWNRQKPVRIGTVSIKEEKGRIVSRVTQPFGRVSIPSIFFPWRREWKEIFGSVSIVYMGCRLDVGRRLSV